MIKIANITSPDRLYGFSSSKSTAMIYMTAPQRNIIRELDVDSWRVRRHPKNKNVIELYVDPAALDSRKRFICDIVFQL